MLQRSSSSRCERVQQDFDTSEKAHCRHSLRTTPTAGRLQWPFSHAVFHCHVRPAPTLREPQPVRRSWRQVLAFRRSALCRQLGRAEGWNGGRRRFRPGVLSLDMVAPILSSSSLILMSSRALSSVSMSSNIAAVPSFRCARIWICTRTVLRLRCVATLSKPVEAGAGGVRNFGDCDNAQAQAIADSCK